MKKIVGFFAVLCAAGVLFADTYNGDIQLHTGIGFGSNVTFWKNADDELEKTTMPVVAFDIELETWHLFTLTDTVGLGFMFSSTLCFGGSSDSSIYIDDHFETADTGTNIFSTCGRIGPAVGFLFGSVARLNISCGFAYGLEYAFPEADDMFSYSFLGAGVGTTVQAKFVPKSVVSPIVGYRFTFLFSKTMEIKEHIFAFDTIQFGAHQGIACFNNELYLGISFNW